MHKSASKKIREMRLLEALGIGINSTTYNIFADCNNWREDDAPDLERELSEMLVLKQEIERAILDDIATGKLKTKVHNIPLSFEYQWNREHNFLEIICRDPKIKAVITFSGSNNDPMISDFTGRADSIIKIASEYLACKSIDFNQDEFEKSIEDEKLQLHQDISKAFPDFDRIKKLLQIFVIKLSVKIVQASKDSDDKDIPTIAEIKDTRDTLWQLVIEEASNRERPNIYWAYTLNVSDKTTDAVVRALFPRSAATQSSNRRLLDSGDFANSWDTRDTVVCINHTSKEPSVSIVKEVSSCRASALVHVRDDDKEAAAKRLKTLQDNISKVARERIIAILKKNPQTNIPTELQVPFLYNTLLSPIVGKSSKMASAAGAVFGKSVRKFLDEGNEKQIWLDTQVAIAMLQEAGALTLTSTDKLEIKSQVSKATFARIKEDLDKVSIKHTSAHFNFRMNSLGKWTNPLLESEIKNSNIAGLKSISDVIQNYLLNLIAKDNDFKNDRAFATVLQNCALPILQSQSPTWKSDLENTLVQLKEYLNGMAKNSNSKALECQKLLEIFKYYVELKSYLLGAKKFSGDVSNQSFAAANAILLWGLLGGTSLSSCKSAKDRTELACVITDSVMATGTLDPQYIYNGLKYGPGAHLVTYNVTGCDFLGLQIDAGILDSIDPDGKIKELLSAKMSRKVGKLGEAIFNSKDNMITSVLKSTYEGEGDTIGDIVSDTTSSDDETPLAVKKIASTFEGSGVKQTAKLIEEGRILEPGIIQQELQRKSLKVNANPQQSEAPSTSKVQKQNTLPKRPKRPKAFPEKPLEPIAIPIIREPVKPLKKVTAEPFIQEAKKLLFAPDTPVSTVQTRIPVTSTQDKLLPKNANPECQLDKKKTVREIWQEREKAAQQAKDKRESQQIDNKRDRNDKSHKPT